MFTKQQMINAVLERNNDFDGLFYICVKTTRIYCLTSCRARMPKIENVEFVKTSEEAELLDYKPCKRCKPHLLSSSDKPAMPRFESAIHHFNTKLADATPVKAAQSAGISLEQLSRDFKKYSGESPVSYLNRLRVDRAALMLANGKSDSDACFEVGFDSLSNFYRLFKKRLRCTPSVFKNSAKQFITHGKAGFVINVHKNYRFTHTLSMIVKETHGTTSAFINGIFQRVIWVLGEPVLVCILEQNGLYVEFTCRQPTMERFLVALFITKRMLGLDQNIVDFYNKFKNDPVIGTAVKKAKGLSIPTIPDLMECTVWAILGQQTTISSTITLFNILTKTYGTLERFGKYALYLFPQAKEVLDIPVEDLTSLKITRKKAEYLSNAALLINDGVFPTPGRVLGDFQWSLEKLCSFKGIGLWSANYILLRHYGSPYAIPYTDTGLSRAIYLLTGKKTGLKEQIEFFKPYKEYGALCSIALWNYLNDEKSA